MGASQNVLLERGLLKVIERPVAPGDNQLTWNSVAYDVAIEDQEVLQSFPSLDEALQFLDMLAPHTGT